jgi:23S rRNA pseudouridine1911/1915/1917 synthase
VPDGKRRERLDVFLTHHVENATRNKVQQAIERGDVRVNGEIVKPSYKVSPGESVSLVIPSQRPQEVIAQDIPLNIVYEDDRLLIINKPAGMVTHPAYANYEGTLVNALLHYSRGHLSEINNKKGAAKFIRPGIVHRLDKDTSGLMVVAKDDVAHAMLAKQFSDRSITREYWSIVWGAFSGAARSRIGKSGSIDAPLGRSKSDRKKVAVTGTGKHAITDYSVLEEFDYLTLVRCKLHTGRTHQIRVHMAHVGHPVFGDLTYGGRRLTWGELANAKKHQAEHLLEMMPRQALHAKTIGFIHPTTGKQMFFDSELPEDMEAVLAVLRRK